VKALVIGCGRVGSNVSKRLAADGWDVTVIDEREEALQRLGAGWQGKFVMGHGMDSTVLRRAGIEDADAVVVSTNGDNTNIVVGQVAQRRFGVRCVVVRLLDPLRADFYAQRGMQTFCPTQTAISVLTDTVETACAAPPVDEPAEA
jgi:trk system potassium uptake protein TrkA